MNAVAPHTFADYWFYLCVLCVLSGKKRFCTVVSKMSKMLFENFIKLETRCVRRVSKSSGMYPQMTQMDADEKWSRCVQRLSNVSEWLSRMR